MTRVGRWGPTHHEDRPTHAARLAGVAAVAALALLLVPARADAHAELVSTEPAASEQLATAPDEVVLRFTEGVDLADDAVELLDATGERIEIGEAEHPAGERTAVSAALPDLDDGAYVVAWRVVSSDSHPIGGAFTFRVGDAGAVAVDDRALIDEVLGGSRQGDATLGAAYGAVRFAGFAGVTVLVGAVVFLTWLWPAGRDDRRARRVVAGAWLTAVGATVLCIPLQAAYAVGGTLGDAFDLGLVADELGTRSGRSWVARLVVLAVAAVVLPRLRPGRHARSAAVAGGLALLVTVSLTGHAVSGDLVPLAFVTDVVHLSGVSVWLGGLTVIVLALLRDPGVAGDVADDVAGDVAGSDPAPGPGDARPGAGAEAERAVHGFSQVAFAAVVAIVVSGSVQAWRQVGGYDALVETTYGRLLLVKVAFVAAMLAAATASRSWVRRRAVARAHVAGTGLGAGPAQVSALRRSVAAEVGLAVAVLAVTALLVNAVPGESDTAGGGGGPYSTQVTEDGVVLSLDVDPAAVGPVALHLYLNEPNGDPVLPEEVGLTLTLPEEDLGPLTVPLVDFGQGHYSADGAELPLAGDWEVEVLVRTSDIDQTLFEAVVPVS